MEIICFYLTIPHGFDRAFAIDCKGVVHFVSVRKMRIVHIRFSPKVKDTGMMKYVTAAEVGRILSCTPSSARRWLDRNGVPAVSLGPGRGLGLRWNYILVQAAIENATIEKPSPEKTAPKRPKLSQRPLVGRNLREQLALIHGDALQ